jgi:hypothetical protein
MTPTCDHPSRAFGHQIGSWRWRSRWPLGGPTRLSKERQSLLAYVHDKAYVREEKRQELWHWRCRIFSIFSQISLPDDPSLRIPIPCSCSNLESSSCQSHRSMPPSSPIRCLDPDSLVRRSLFLFPTPATEAANLF